MYNTHTFTATETRNTVHVLNKNDYTKFPQFTCVNGEVCEMVYCFLENRMENALVGVFLD